jgi:two-component system sensor histidine kinase TctE
MRRPSDWLKAARTPSIRRRLLVALLPSLVAVLFLGFYLDYRLARQTADTAYDQSLADAVLDLESHLRSEGGVVRIEIGDDADSMLRSAAPDKLYYAVRDEQGKLIAGDADLPPPSGAAPGIVRYADRDFRAQRVRDAVLWTTMPGTKVSIRVAETTRRRNASRDRILAAMMLQNFAVTAVILLSAFLGIRRGLRPLRHLEKEIASRSATDLREIDMAGTPSELHPVLLRLNALFKLVLVAAGRQQRFIADAAHQLRSPLTALQNQLDLAASEHIFNGHAERLEKIETATGRIGHLLRQLLAYAKTENEAAVAERFEMLALDALVGESASEFVDAAVAKNIDLGYEISPATVKGSAWMIREALGNLVDNAIRYTPVDGTITVRCGERPEAVFLEVCDSGPGISKEHAERVFDRFYRIPGARGEGCGLGLSIVHEIAVAHGATIALATSSLGGLEVRVTFPSP